jgi:hypothetical protein
MLRPFYPDVNPGALSPQNYGVPPGRVNPTLLKHKMMTLKRIISREWRIFTACLLIGLVVMPFLLSIFTAIPDIVNYKERLDTGNPWVYKFINDPHNIRLSETERFSRLFEFLDDNDPEFRKLSPGEKESAVREIYRKDISPLQIRETYRNFYGSFWRGYWLLALSPLIVFLLARSVKRSVGQSLNR